MRHSLCKLAGAVWIAIACSSCAGFGHKSFCFAELWKCDKPTAEVEDVSVTVLSRELRVTEDGETTTLPLDAVCFRPATQFAVKPGDVEPEPYFNPPSQDEPLELSQASDSDSDGDAALLRRLRQQDHSEPNSIDIDLERVPMATIAPDFYWTLGTGIGDPEKDANWTSAAIFPLGSENVEPPSMRIHGQTNREEEFIQFMPGFFWRPDEELQFTVGVPLGVTETAPDWGLLFALTY